MVEAMSNSEPVQEKFNNSESKSMMQALPAARALTKGLIMT